MEKEEAWKRQDSGEEKEKREEEKGGYIHTVDSKTNKKQHNKTKQTHKQNPIEKETLKSHELGRDSTR